MTAAQYSMLQNIVNGRVIRVIICGRVQLLWRPYSGNFGTLTTRFSERDLLDYAALVKSTLVDPESIGVMRLTELGHRMVSVKL